jgi:ribose 5-phosphate isomerase B
MIKFSIGADSSANVVLKTKKILKKRGFTLVEHGINDDSLDWVEIARCVANDVRKKRADYGIIFCYTGTGVTIVANRYKGIRASLCNTKEIAICAKKWNNPNIITMGIMSVKENDIEDIINAWLTTKVDKDELENIRKIDE